MADSEPKSTMTAKLAPIKLTCELGKYVHPLTDLEFARYSCSRDPGAILLCGQPVDKMAYNSSAR